MPNRQWVTLFVQRKTIWAQKRKAQMSRVGQVWGRCWLCMCVKEMRERESSRSWISKKKSGRRGRGEEGGRDKEEGLGRGGLGVYRT